MSREFSTVQEVRDQSNWEKLLYWARDGSRVPDRAACLVRDPDNVWWAAVWLDRGFGPYVEVRSDARYKPLLLWLRAFGMRTAPWQPPAPAPEAAPPWEG